MASVKGLSCLYVLTLQLFAGQVVLTHPLNTHDSIEQWIEHESSQSQLICKAKDASKEQLSHDSLICLRENTSDDLFKCCWNVILNVNSTEITHEHLLTNFTCKFKHSSEMKILFANCLLHDHLHYNSSGRNISNEDKNVQKCLPNALFSFVQLNKSKSHVESLSHVTSVISVESDPKYTNYDLYCPKEHSGNKMCLEEKIYHEQMKQVCANDHQSQLIQMVKNKTCLANQSNEVQLEALNICWHLVTGEFYPKNLTRWKQFLCSNQFRPEQLLKIIQECYDEFEGGKFSLQLFAHINDSTNESNKKPPQLIDEQKRCNLSQFIFTSDLESLQVHRKAYNLVKHIYLAEKYLQDFCHINDTQVERVLLSHVNCNNNNNNYMNINTSTSDQMFTNSVMRFCWKYTLDINIPSSASEWKNFFCCQSSEARAKASNLLHQCYTQSVMNLMKNDTKLLRKLSQCALSLVDPFGQLSLLE